MATLTDGLELGRYVRAHCPGVSLVLASAQAAPITDDVMFDDFFVKPFAPEDIVAVIERRHASAPNAADSAVPLTGGQTRRECSTTRKSRSLSPIKPTG